VLQTTITYKRTKPCSERPTQLNSTGYIDLSGLQQVRDFFWSLTCLRHVGDLFKTCRRPGRKPGFKQVLSKIDVMEFGLKRIKSRNTREVRRKIKIMGEEIGNFCDQTTSFGHCVVSFPLISAHSTNNHYAVSSIILPRVKICCNTCLPF